MSPRHVVPLWLWSLAGCALEVPTAEPTFDSGRPTLTIYQVQDIDADGHPDLDSLVRSVNLVVTAVDRFDEDGSGKTGTVFVQEMGGGPFSGIQLYRPTIQPASEYLLPGDVVEVAGTYVEFELGQINPDWADETGRTVSQIADGIVRKTGEWIAPEATVVDQPEEIGEDPAAEGWEGVLVEVDRVTATAAPDSHGAFPIEGGGKVDDDNYGIPDVAVGTGFSHVAGVVTYMYTYNLLPRSALDVELGAPAQD